MARAKYRTVKLPKDLVDEVEVFWQEEDIYGFRSNAEVVTHAVRQFLIEAKAEVRRREEERAELDEPED